MCGFERMWVKVDENEFVCMTVDDDELGAGVWKSEAVFFGIHDAFLEGPKLEPVAVGRGFVLQDLDGE